MSTRHPSAPTTAWWDINPTGQAGGVLYLTDEQALDMLERGRNIRPVAGLTATIDRLQTAATTA